MLKANAVLHEIVCSKITRWGLDSSVIIFASLANGLLPGYFNRGSGDFPVQCWWSPAIKTVLTNTSELFSSKPSHSPIHCIVFGVLCFSEWNCKAHTHLKHSIFFSISDDSLLLCYCKAREGVWLFSDLICCWKFFFHVCFTSAVAFRIYDMDKDGYISNGELFQVLKMMVGNNLKDTQLQQIVDKTIINADKDGDGRISFEEFCAVSNLSGKFSSVWWTEHKTRP